MLPTDARDPLPEGRHERNGLMKLRGWSGLLMLFALALPHQWRLMQLAGTPSIRASKPATSSLVKTLGIRRLAAGRLMPSIHGKSMFRTSRYRNSKALLAWFWVDAATLPTTAR